MQDFGTKANDTAGPSGQLSAEEFNNLASELENAVTRSGLSLDAGSVVQLATSLFLHGVKSQTFQDNGVSNAYVATPVSGLSGVLLPANYLSMNGSQIIFKASNANTGASTLNIGQTTGTLLGAKAIVDQAGAAIASGAISASTYVSLRYDSSLDSGNGAWVLLPSSRALATTAQAQAWLSNQTLLSPFLLAEAFKGGNQSLTLNGFQKMPGGYILQHGESNGASTTANVTFPLTFPAAGLFAIAIDSESVPANIKYCGFNTLLPGSVNFVFSGVPAVFKWYAVGF